jgi:hypothetical protein
VKDVGTVADHEVIELVLSWVGDTAIVVSTIMTSRGVTADDELGDA